MKRRGFVSGAAGAIASGLLSTPPSNAQTTGIASYRRSLLMSSKTYGLGTQVQDLVLWNNMIYCLYSTFPLSNRSWFLSVTSADGSSVSELQVPAAEYLRIGIQDGAVLLNALTFVDASGQSNVNCVVRLGPSGSATVLESLGPSFKGQLLFAGDSTFVRVDTAAVDVWRLSGSAMESGATSAIQPWTIFPNADLLASDTLVLTSVDGTILQA